MNANSLSNTHRLGVPVIDVTITPNSRHLEGLQKCTYADVDIFRCHILSLDELGSARCQGSKLRAHVLDNTEGTQ